MKRLLFVVWATLFCSVIVAVPVERVRMQVTLMDGTTVFVTQYGDEHYGWLQTDDGYIVNETADGVHYVLTDKRAVDVVPQIMADQRAKLPRRVGSQKSAPLPSKGSPRVPVVLVNFTDSVFTVRDNDEELRQYYDLYCNGTRDGNLYQKHGSYGSIRDYFNDQSNGQFTPEFVIIGPVTLENPESYYGENLYNEKGEVTKRDINYNAFCSEAISKATELFEGDWMTFDNKGKGQVDMVFFIFAGCGEANGGAPTTMWPKESTSSVTINGIKFATSGICNEMRGNRTNGVVTSTRPDGVGIMCHELSHALGLPDFYGNASFGMDLWSLMDYGCYGSNGYVPCAYTAYEREFMGWQQMEVLSEAQALTISPIADGGKGYKIVNAENANEYYVLENRQSVGWDTSIGKMGHGLQVTHVDYNSSAWNGNKVNTDANHQRMTIIAANNLYKGTSYAQITPDATQAEVLETWAGNLYPFRENNSLTPSSTPAATVYTEAGFMSEEQALTDIKENEDHTVSLFYGKNEETGINDIVPTSNNNRYYDLQGRAVNPWSMQRGIFISNGKKHIVK